MEIKTHTYYEHGSYESFTCSAICVDNHADESGTSSTVDEAAASETTLFVVSEDKKNRVSQ